MCSFFIKTKFAQSYVRLDVNKLVGGILWERCAASCRRYLCAAGGLAKEDGFCLLWGWLVAVEDGALEVSEDGGDVAAACGVGALGRRRADSGLRARGATACIHL